MDKRVEIEKIFTLPDLQYLYEEMRKLGFDTVKVAADFKKSYVEKGKHLPETNYFVHYGFEVIEPLLNERLNRPKGHPTFYNLIKYIQDVKLKNRKVV
jgi:hypothetical protein